MKTQRVPYPEWSSQEVGLEQQLSSAHPWNCTHESKGVKLALPDASKAATMTEASVRVSGIRRELSQKIASQLTTATHIL